jgi:hypothetical protein
VAYRNAAGAAAADAVSEAREIPAERRPVSDTAGKPGSVSVRGMAGAKSSVPRSYGESCDDYRAVVAVLEDDRRVIECSDGIQWVIQKRVRGPRPWRPIYYCRTKAGLLLYAGPITPELLALPEYFERRSKDDWLDWQPHEGAP